jgi:serine/threonine-protein kinase
MPLSIGTRLGPYEILAPLGAGGMGEVYRAKDTKLGREIALKLLSASFTNDPDRVARFRREAQVLASLNHPHIAQIHGLDEANGTQFLVLELVDGESLDKRIARGRIPVDEALAIAKQIAAALEAAHEKGIIHRDLKPANIALTCDGTVKVLDFGLAKATEAASGTSLDVTNSPTITTPAMMTGVGVILGTAAYMSPEQAKGRPADKRSDIWAFGCALFEMLSGQRAFDGEDVSDTLANVLKVEPEWNRLPDDVPERVRVMLQRCLEKDRGKRLSDASIARYVMTETVAISAGLAIAAAGQPRWRRAATVIMTALIAAAIAATLVWTGSRQPVVPVMRFPILLPEGQQFAVRSQLVAVSPDGTRVAYAAGEGQVYLRSMAEMDAHAIAGTNLNVMSPFFSPDGQWIGFYSFQDRTLKKISVSGGTPLTICKADPPYGVTWDGDWIIFADQGTKGILRVSANGGQPEVLVAVKPGEVFAAPQMLDSGRTVLFTVASAQVGNLRWDQAQIAIQGVGSAERRVIMRGGSEGRYVPTGHLVYMLGGTLLAVPVDRGTLQVRGGPVPMIDGIRRGLTTYGSPAGNFAFSPTGSLVYILSATAADAPLRTLALATRDGALQQLDVPPQPYNHPRVSPDGSELAVETDDGKDAIIWIYDLRRGGPLRRLTFGGRNKYPVWTRDGRRVTFQSDRDGDHGIFWQLADGTRPAERLSKPDSLVQEFPEAWTPDGRTLSFAVVPPFDARLFTLSTDNGPPKPLSADLPALHAAFSPDGKWLAYASNEIGNRREIFIQPFPPTGAKYQISTEGGTTPLWSPDGTQLYYYGPNQRLIAVDVRARPTFTTGKKVVLPIDAIFMAGIIFPETNYDLTPDGKHFVLVARADSASPDPNKPPKSQIEFVFNWFEELKARVPTK